MKKEGRNKEMLLALAQARAAAERGEVPVGAVLVDPQGEVIARAGNRVEEWGDASAHAEMIVMREAMRVRNKRKLMDCTLVVTLEPCAMCAAAMIHFRVGRLVFGAYDQKGGAVDHGPRLFDREDSLHRPEVIGGVCEQESAFMLKDFFNKRR